MALIGKHLLMGLSRRMACAKAGVTGEALRVWCLEDREIAKLMKQCESLGFGGVFESELYTRALAGPDDKGSMRALELIAKSRGPEYREKLAIEHTLRTQAMDARDTLDGDWSVPAGE